MQNLLNDNLKTALKTDPRCIVDGELNKVKVEELALEMDSGLLKLLMSDPALKKHFFTQVDDIQVFDKIKFQRFINNKAILPDSYTAYKNKVGLTDENGNYISESREVVLSWPYKDCVLEGGQDKEDAKRDEVFFNEILAPDQIDYLLEPKVLTNFKKHDAKGEHDVSDITYDDNLLIKGNNLLTLHSIEKVYAGKVKLIYIDPPYNTDRDSFLYNDNFKASSWLTFMRNRFLAAKNLLSSKGVFIIQLSDHRVAEAKLLLDEVFGRGNFVNQISVKTRSPSGFKTVNLGTFEAAEYIYIYAKDKANIKYKTQYVASDYDQNYKYVIRNFDSAHSDWKIEQVNHIVAMDLGYEDSKKAKKEIGEQAFLLKCSEYALQNCDVIFRYTEINDDASKEAVELRDKSTNDEKIYELNGTSGKIYIHKGKQLAFYSKKVREIDGIKTPTMILSNIWTDIPWEGIANEGGVKLKEGKKPEKLIRRFLNMYTNEGDLILDYHLGSGSTCAVAHKMNRRYIGVEQLDYGKNDSLIRLNNVINNDQTGISKLVGWQGGGSFIYCELAKCNQSFIDMVMDAKDNKTLTTLLETIKDKGFISYKVDKDKFDGFGSLSFDDKKKFLIEVLDKNMLYVNLSEIEDKDHGISKDDIKLNRLFYTLEKQQNAFAE